MRALADRVVVLACVFFSVLVPPVPGAAVDVSALCQKAKLDAVAHYTRCRMRREARFFINGNVEARELGAYQCGIVFRNEWRRTEATYAAACPQLDYRPAFDHVAVEAVHRIVAGFSGAARFVDNGDGTIADTLLGVIWEAKNSDDGIADPANASDVDNVYDWDTAVGSWIDQLNATAPGGHDDWRVPAWSELQSIHSALVPGCGSWGACIDPIFGPTVTLGESGYWTSTEVDDPTVAGNIAFNSFVDSYFTGLTKFVPQHVRAVRNMP